VSEMSGEAQAMIPGLVARASGHRDDLPRQPMSHCALANLRQRQK
jgi:hypothetical protein